MDFTSEFLKFFLRVDKLVRPLFKYYSISQDLLKKVEAEKPSDPKSLFMDSQTLRKKLGAKTKYPHEMKAYLAEKLDSYTALLDDLSGSIVSHKEYVTRVYGLNMRKISEGEIRNLHNKLGALFRQLGYNGYIPEALRRWSEEQELSGEKMLEEFRRQIREAYRRTQKLIDIPDDMPQIKVLGVRNVPYRMQADVFAENPLIKVNLDYKITKADLKELAYHECYPGHYLHLFTFRKRWIANERYPVLGHFSQYSKCLPIVEGIGEMASTFVNGEPDDIDDKINRLRIELIKHGNINLDFMKWEEQRDDKELAGFMKEKLLMSEDNIKNKLKWVTNPRLKGYDTAYWTGKTMIEDMWKTVQKQDRINYIKILYETLPSLMIVQFILDS